MPNGQFITKEDGRTFVKDYQAQNPNATKAYLYDGSLIEEILDQTDCTGIRIYNGINSNGKSCLVIVGTNASGDDLTDGKIVEFGAPCPATCPISSYFN